MAQAGVQPTTRSGQVNTNIKADWFDLLLAGGLFPRATVLTVMPCSTRDRTAAIKTVRHAEALLYVRCDSTHPPAHNADQPAGLG